MNRKKLIILFLIFIFLISLFFLINKSYKIFEFTKINKNDFETEVRGILMKLKKNLPHEYPSNAFKPFADESCIINNSNCKPYFSKIRTFINNPDPIKIIIFSDDSLNGRVSQEFPRTIQISTILKDQTEEIERTLIHELAHLSDWYGSNHGSDKMKCEYFKSMPLTCEYCLTGKATYAPVPPLNSIMNKNQKSCTIYH